jgi:hypothetical protein
LRQFVSALESTTLVITKKNFRRLLLLFANFGFGLLQARLLARGQCPRESTCATHFFGETFAVKENGAALKCELAKATTLSPAVRERLSVDACARTFALRGADALDSLRLLLSGGGVLDGQ